MSNRVLLPSRCANGTGSWAGSSRSSTTSGQSSPVDPSALPWAQRSHSTKLTKATRPHDGRLPQSSARHLVRTRRDEWMRVAIHPLGRSNWITLAGRIPRHRTCLTAPAHQRRDPTQHHASRRTYRHPTPGAANHDPDRSDLAANRRPSPLAGSAARYGVWRIRRRRLIGVLLDQRPDSRARRTATHRRRSR